MSSLSALRRGRRCFSVAPPGRAKLLCSTPWPGSSARVSGEVTFDGRVALRAPKNRQAAIRNRRMGYIFQNYFLMPELTALENVLLPAFMGAGRSARIVRA